MNDWVQSHRINARTAVRHASKVKRAAAQIEVVEAKLGEHAEIGSKVYASSRGNVEARIEPSGSPHRLGKPAADVECELVSHLRGRGPGEKQTSQRADHDVK